MARIPLLSMKTIAFEGANAHYGDASQVLFIYNGMDVLLTHEIHEVLSSQLDDISSRTYTFTRRMQGPAMEMMVRGLRVDPVAKFELTSKWEARVRELLSLFHTLTEAISGMALNPNSPKQMKELFYEHLHLTHVYTYKKGQRKLSTDKEALEKLYTNHVARPFISLIRSIRETNKLLQVMRKGVDEDGRIRTSYNICGTETGRWSSSSNAFGTGDNLQNWTDAVRRIIRADPGMKLAYCDLDTAESLAVAYLSGDESYIEACHSGDIHTMVARWVWPELPWTGDLKIDRGIADEPYIGHHSRRFMCKGVGHGSNYYGQPPTIARHLRMESGPVAAFQANYFMRFPQIPKWHRNVAHHLHVDGHLTSPFGRRRHFFGRRHDDTTLREAIAQVPQSMIGDYLNEALYRLWTHKGLRQQGMELLAQVHDAVLLQYPEHLEQTLLPEILSLMSFPVEVTDIGNTKRSLTIPTSAEVGWNWSHEAKDGSNPYGLRSFSPGTPDDRSAPAESTLLDCRL